MYDQVEDALRHVTHHQGMHQSYYQLQSDERWVSRLTHEEDLSHIAHVYAKLPQDATNRILHISWSHIPGYTPYGQGIETVYYALRDARELEPLLNAHMRYLDTLANANDWLSLDRYFHLTLQRTDSPRYVVETAVNGTLRPHLFPSNLAANLFAQSLDRSFTAYAVTFRNDITYTELARGTHIDRLIPRLDT